MSLHLNHQSKLYLEKLQTFAEQHNRSLDEVLGFIVEKIDHVVLESDAQTIVGTPASQFLKLAKLMNYEDGEENTIENMREIFRDIQT